MLASNITETRNKGVVVLFRGLSIDNRVTSCLLQVNARLRPILTSMEHRSYMIKHGGCRKSVSILFFIIVFSSFSAIVSSNSHDFSEYYEVEIVSPPIIEKIPHDTSAFTQGLLIYDGFLYESTGLYGKSSLRIVNMSNGEVEKMITLPENYFAEGLAMINQSLIQLTWNGNIGFIYNSSSLESIGNFTYDGEGWGICNTESNKLWFSDGSYELFNFIPENLSLSELSLIIRYNGSTINRLNELECPSNSGLIFANVWFEDRIIGINQSTGQVCVEYDISEIRAQYESTTSRELNGIAYDSESSLFWITGKNWSNYYVVDLQVYTNDCISQEYLEDCCFKDEWPFLRILVLIIIGIFAMPFSWPLFGMIFYKLFRRQTHASPPSATTKNEHEG
jgi:glutamine cyclotransferase